MRKFLSALFKKISEMLEKTSPQTTPVEEGSNEIINESPSLKINKTQEKTSKKEKKTVIPYVANPARDLMEIMEVPFLALSKNRKSSILYESSDGTRKVKVTRHTGHFLASIYDWDIILFVASKMQRILNEMSDIPPRSMIVPRHELLKAIHRRQW